ncbi:YrhB domain-containing protein [Kitasatospora sp. NPDC059571]|uniref:YrhB domain-containing protein n=1 Tax=Kitasatospora sp. NPDC059571 TaxID=3346871 RepID=UPI0036A45FF7
MESVISQQQAVELVESYLERERPTWTWARLIPKLAVYAVEERAVGWLAYWTSAEGARNPALRGNLLGGPLLVDREDGSIHFVPGSRLTDDWEEDYLWQVKGIRPPDPLAASVRHLADSVGIAAAMQHLRKQATRMSLKEAKAYVTSVRDGSEPPEELASLTRKPNPDLGPIETLASPVR